MYHWCVKGKSLNMAWLFMNFPSVGGGYPEEADVDGIIRGNTNKILFCKLHLPKIEPLC